MSKNHIYQWVLHIGLSLSLWACQTPNSASTGAGVKVPSQASLTQESLNPQTDQAANIPPNKSDDLLIASLPAELDIPTDPLAAPVPTFDTKTDITQPPPQVRVAMLVPRTGLGAKEGRDLINAAIMALFDFKNDLLDLRIYDTKGQADVATMMAKTAMKDGADIIVGPLLSASVEAVSAELKDKNIPIISFSNNLDVASAQTHITGFVPKQQVRRLLDHARQEKLMRIAMLFPDNAYGRLIAQKMQNYAPEYGVQLVKTMAFKPGAIDYSQQIRQFANYNQRRWQRKQKIARLQNRNDRASQAALRFLQQSDTDGPPNYDAVLLAVTDDISLRNLSAQLAFFDVAPPDVRILGLQLWDSFANLHQEPALIGAHFVAPDAIGRQDFVRKFERLYGTKPYRLSSIGYDVMSVISMMGVADKAGENWDNFDQKILAHPQGFFGVEGLFRLMPDGISERGLAIMEVRKNGVQLLKDAPKRFSMPPSPQQQTQVTLPDEGEQG